MTDNSVQQAPEVVNAETPQERLDRALMDVTVWQGVLAIHTATLASRQHSFDVANGNLVQLVEDARVALAAYSRIVGDLIGSQHTDDEQDDDDDNFHGRQMDLRIEAERRQDAQISRAAADYLRGE